MIKWVVQMVLLIPLWLFLAVGCSLEEISVKVSSDNVVPVSFQLIMQPVHISVNQDGMPDVKMETRSGDDATINNLTVLQFDWDAETGGNGATATCVTSRYLRAPEPLENTTDQYSIGLRSQGSGQKQYLVFIANAGSVFQQYEGKTLGDFREETVLLDQKTSSTENVLMIGTTNVPIESTENEVPFPVNLKRLVARIDFTWEAKPTVTGTTFTPSSLRLMNVPKDLRYADGITGAITADDYPAKEATNFKNYTSIVDHIEEGFTWYIPLNRHSQKGTAENIWEKTAGTAPDPFCTFIELAGVYRTPNMPDQLATYSFFVGGDMTKDYNVFQNYNYKVHAEITGVNTFDLRVTKEDFVYNDPANCYMISPEPDNQVSFNPSLAPGADVTGSGVVYKDQVVEDRYAKVAKAGIVWQTSDGLVTDVKLEKGLIRVTPNADGVSGNALIAAYDEKDVILWSWHIWVTPYAKSVEAGKTTSDGAIQVYNNLTWMDRNIGATALVLLQTGANGLMYQWGRKDPFASSDATIAYTTKSGGTALNISESLAEPTVFYTQSSGNNTWYGYLIPDLWDSNRKTIYDPCPAGWIVPKHGSWSLFNSNTVQGVWGSGGCDFLYGESKTYYPYSGMRLATNAALQSVNSVGYCWSSTSNEQNALSIRLSGNLGTSISVSFPAQSQTVGLPVRCVKIK
nr:fimbrial protein [Parabacteroides goldsteinii]